MCIFTISLFILSNLFGIIANPYCNLFCQSRYIKSENGLCKLFERVLRAKHDNEGYGIYPMTDAMRHMILQFINSQRNVFAKGKLHNVQNARPVANMQYINYDMQLEFLAEAQASFPDLSAEPVPTCLRTDQFFVDYIHTCYKYNSSDEMVTGSMHASLSSILQYWSTVPVSTLIPFKVKTPQSLIYWAKLDLVGCAIYLSPSEEDAFSTNLGTVCMFGSVESPPRSLAGKQYLPGFPCKKCRPPTFCSTERFKALCGMHEGLSEVHMKWNKTFWSLHGYNSPKYNVLEAAPNASNANALHISRALLIIYTMLSVFVNNKFDS